MALRSAADVISGNPAAMQLRYLQVGTGRNIRVGRQRKIEFEDGLKDQLNGNNHRPLVTIITLSVALPRRAHQYHV